MTIFKEYNENWEKIAPISFLYERDTPRSKEISRALKQFYFKGQPISLANIQGLADVRYKFKENTKKHPPEIYKNLLLRVLILAALRRWSGWLQRSQPR